MTLLDHQFNLDPESVEEPSMERPKVDLNTEVSKSFYEKELEEIKKSIEKVGKDIDSDSDDELLVVKDKGKSLDTRKPRNKLGDILDKIEEQEDKDIQNLKEVWSRPKNLSEEDRFLRDYILNKRYLPKPADDEDNADDEGDGNDYFSKDIDQLSDVDEDEPQKSQKDRVLTHPSDERDFEKIVRIPRNSTKTIRDLVEKQEKKERRLKKLEKEKRKKKAIKDADCEDVVGDLPTRFHYRETEPNDYGLTAEELLLATDEELDQWVSLRDCIAYKTPEEEEAHKRKFARRRDDIELKRKIFKSIYGEPDNQTDEQADQSAVSAQSTLTVKKKKKTRGKKRKREMEEESSYKESANNSPQEEVTEPPNSHADSKNSAEESNRQRKKRKKTRGLNHKKFAKIGVAPDRLLAYGFSKSKLKKSNIL